MLAAMAPGGISGAVSDVAISGELFAQPARLQPCLDKVGHKRATGRMNSRDVLDCSRESYWRVCSIKQLSVSIIGSWSKGEWGNRELRAIWLSKQRPGKQER